METVWTCAPDNMLIAPPSDPHVYVGWAAIKRNWESYWPTFDQFRVSMRVNKVNISGPVAWVHGIETSYRRRKSGEVSSSHNYGTNIFVYRNGRWLMVSLRSVSNRDLCAHLDHPAGWNLKEVRCVARAACKTNE